MGTSDSMVGVKRINVLNNYIIVLNCYIIDMWKIPLNGSPKEWEEIKQLGEVPPTCCNFPGK